MQKTSHNVQFNTNNNYNTFATTSNGTNSDYNLMSKKNTSKDKMFQSLSLESSKFQNGTTNSTLPNTTSLPINNPELSNPQIKNQLSFTTSNIFSNDNNFDPKLNQSIDLNALL